MQILKNWGKIGEGVIRFLSKTNSILLFGPHCAKFHQDQIKIAAIGVFTDGQTE